MDVSNYWTKPQNPNCWNERGCGNAWYIFEIPCHYIDKDDNCCRWPVHSDPTNPNQAICKDISSKPTVLNVFFMLCTWILIFTNLVPISLMVSLEIVKFWQAIFMSFDVDMYD